MKRAITLILLAAICTGTIACGETSAPAADDTTASEADTTAAETSIYDVIPQKDFGGEEFKIYSYASSQSYNDAEYLTAEQTGEVIDDAVYKRNVLTEERLNIKLSYTAVDSEYDARDKYNNSMLAGDAMCDIFVHKGGYLSVFMAAGTILPWDDVPGIDLDQPWYPKFANDVITLGNRNYGFLSDAWATSITMAWTVAFNKRLADEWKIENPYDIVRAGDWTVDKMISMTKDIWKDVNGDNQADAGDVYGFYTDKWATLDAFMVSHGIVSIGKDKDDFPEVLFYSDRLVESFEKVYELYWENPGTYVDTTTPYVYQETGFAAGLGLFSPMMINDLIAPKMRAMEDDYGVLPYPKMDENQEDYRTYLLTRTGVFMLPVTIADDKLDKLGYIVETLSAYSHQYLRPAIYDVSLGGKAVRDEESLEMLDFIMARRGFDFSQITENENKYPFAAYKTYRNLIGAKNNGITTYYESNKTAAEENLQAFREYVE